MCLDEYQRAPDVLDAIKARLNRDGSRPGTAVITGPTRQDALPRTAQALTGRLHSLTIWPLSHGEIGGVIEDMYFEAVFWIVKLGDTVYQSLGHIHFIVEG